MYNNKITKIRQSLMVLRVDDPDTAVQSKAGSWRRSTCTEKMINFTWSSIYFFNCMIKYITYVENRLKQKYMILLMCISQWNIYNNARLSMNYPSLIQSLILSGCARWPARTEYMYGQSFLQLHCNTDVCKNEQSDRQVVPCNVGEMGSGPIYI